MLAIEALNIVNAHMSTLADQEEDRDPMMLFPYEFIRQKISTVNRDLYNNKPKQIPTYGVGDDYSPRMVLYDNEPILVTDDDSFDFIKPNYILYQDTKICMLINEYEKKMYRELVIWPGLEAIFLQLYDGIMLAAAQIKDDDHYNFVIDNLTIDKWFYP